MYEYFLSQFAGAEGKRGGEFYTPQSVVRVLVEILEPYSGRVYDPCCGSGGMFVQSEKFVAEHGGRTGDIAIYGQESNYTTWRLCKMNLAVRGIDSDICWNNKEPLFSHRRAFAVQKAVSEHLPDHTLAWLERLRSYRLSARANWARKWPWSFSIWA